MATRGTACFFGLGLIFQLGSLPFNLILVMDNVHKRSKNKILTEASSFSQNKHLKIILERTTKLKTNKQKIYTRWEKNNGAKQVQEDSL